MLRSIQFWAGVAISGLFIALFLRTTHPRELKDAMEQANYWWLIPAVAVLFVAIIVRCLRWSILMRPLADISPWRLLPYAIIGYMANNLLPARAGEVVRAYVTGERENITRMGVLGTVAVERLFDGCVLVIMLLVSGAIVGFDDGRLQAIAIVSSFIFLAALVGFYILTRTEERARKVIHFGLRLLPKRLEPLVEGIAESLVISLRSVHSAKTFSTVLVLSATAWTIEAGSYAVLGQGFDLGVGFANYCLLLAAANLAIIVPTFFGGTGPFEWAAKLTLTGSGVAAPLASAYSVIAHAFVLIPTTIIGLIILWSYGLSFRRLTQARATVVEEPLP